MRTNTQVSDMRIWHVDTSARLSAKAAHEMQTFLHELRKLKKCQRTLDTNYFIFSVATIPIKEYTYIGIIVSFGGKLWIT